MSTSIMVLIVMGIVGIIFGFVLAYANKKFAVEVNPLIHIVEDVLPKGQCGACGYAGCQAYAEAVVTDPAVSPALCTPGKEAVAKLVAELTGKTAPAVEARVAHVKCAGVYGTAVRKYRYEGVEDCVAATLLQGGPKACAYGCVGFGTCVSHCPFDAMTLREDGLPIIDEEKCTGCGKCETVCPKNVIQMLPVGARVRVDCNSRDKGISAKKHCSAACIGCGLCTRECPHGAVKMENNLAVVDSRICMELCSEAKCIGKCPTKAITSVVKAPLSQEDFAAASRVS